MKDLLYTVANDKNGNLIKANDAEKGNDFFCPVCKSEVILRKSGKIGKGTKRPHFAHQSLTPNCTPETALHFAFKTLLAKKLEEFIATKKTLENSWNCKYCFDKHSSNLFEKIKSIKVEYNLTVSKPDIALFDNDENLVAVIEVVVTHKPEESVLQFYDDNDIIVVQINLTSDADIENLVDKITNPDIVTTCLNLKCDNCGHFKQKTKMTIVDGFCWKCDAAMKVAVIEGVMELNDETKSPDEFTTEEIYFARSKGVLINEHYSKTAQSKYLANTCPSCKTFAGNFYLFTQYLQPASIGELESETFEIGYHCSYCAGEEYIDDEDLDF